MSENKSIVVTDESGNVLREYNEDGKETYTYQGGGSALGRSLGSRATYKVATLLVMCILIFLVMYAMYKRARKRATVTDDEEEKPWLDNKDNIASVTEFIGVRTLIIYKYKDGSHTTLSYTNEEIVRAIIDELKNSGIEVDVVEGI